MARRKKIDWEDVEKKYRAGQLSIREIARRHGCVDGTIRRKAKKEDWDRDLSKKIREDVRIKLIREKMRTPNEDMLFEKDIVDEGVTLGFEVELMQRKDISTLRALEVRFLKELSDDPKKLYITQYKGEIVQQEVKLTISEKAIALSNLANVMQKRICLERQAYNQDATEENKEKSFIFNKIELPASIRDLIPVKR